MRSPDVRASDADRERAAELLRRHAGAGRITVEELDERTGRALRALTIAELEALLEDLPRGLTPPPAATRPAQRRRPPKLPGTYTFAVAWRAPAGRTRVGREFLAEVVPPMAARGYRLLERSSERIVFEIEFRPAWTIAVAVLVFPIGLLALLHKEHDEIVVELEEEGDRGTIVTVYGVAPLAVRRAFHQLAD